MSGATGRGLLLGLLLLVLAVPTVVRAAGDHARFALVVAAVVVPYAAAVLLLFLLFLLQRKRWRLAVVAAVLVAVNAVWLVPIWTSSSVPSGQTLTVMTVNLRLGRGDVGPVVRAVRERHVDVLALQELTPLEASRLRTAGIGTLLPYAHVLPEAGASGSGLLSRYPLVAQPTWPGELGMPGATVLVGGRAVTVRVVHPWPAGRSGSSRFVRDYDTIRDRTAALSRGTPTIVLGDFNATRDNSELRDVMSDRFRDAPEVCGAGLVRTWSPGPWSPSLFDLDHVLVDDHLGVRSTSTVEVPCSDHRALLATLVQH